jgi:formylglycine-generating enzyme required for sulfatase activity
MEHASQRPGCVVNTNLTPELSCIHELSFAAREWYAQPDVPRLPALLVMVVCLGVHGGCDADAPPAMVLVPGGEFLMGSAPDDPDVYPWERKREQPQHPVTLPPFLIDRFEVTNAEFERLRPDHPRSARSACDDCPVTEVSWHDAVAYCAAQVPAKRLPTEAEWEKAAKAGAAAPPRPLDDYAWYDANAIGGARPVGRKRPNALGIHDMLGNVREWTSTWYASDAYRRPGRPIDDPGPLGRRVERGGAFFLPARGVTATIRYNHPPHFRLYFLGFRCARDAASTARQRSVDPPRSP